MEYAIQANCNPVARPVKESGGFAPVKHEKFYRPYGKPLGLSKSKQLTGAIGAGKIASTRRNTTP